MENRRQMRGHAGLPSEYCKLKKQLLAVFRKIRIEAKFRVHQWTRSEKLNRIDVFFVKCEQF